MQDMIPHHHQAITRRSRWLRSWATAPIGRN
jgi:hypothetical protein